MISALKINAKLWVPIFWERVLKDSTAFEKQLQKVDEFLEIEIKCSFSMRGVSEQYSRSPSKVKV